MDLFSLTDQSRFQIQKISLNLNKVGLETLSSDLKQIFSFFTKLFLTNILICLNSIWFKKQFINYFDKYFYFWNWFEKWWNSKNYNYGETFCREMNVLKMKINLRINFCKKMLKTLLETLTLCKSLIYHLLGFSDYVLTNRT